MKLMKRLLAVSLGVALLLPMTAYADQANDAMALFNQVEEKSKTMTDMNAFYDFHIKMDAGTQGGPGEAMAPVDMRMEMNVKMNHLTDLDNMRFMAYSRITMPGNAQITSTQYYLDGYNYMDMLGQKIKYPMPMADMMKQVESSASAFDLPSDYIKDLSLSNDQDGNRVLSFTMDDNAMNGYIQNLLGSSQFGTMTEGTAMSLHNMSGQYVVNANGDLIKIRMKMDMNMTAGGQTMNMSLDGDVGIADPGQPVDVPTPDVSQYQEMAMPSK